MSKRQINAHSEVLPSDWLRAILHSDLSIHRTSIERNLHLSLDFGCSSQKSFYPSIYTALVKTSAKSSRLGQPPHWANLLWIVVVLIDDQEHRAHKKTSASLMRLSYTRFEFLTHRRGDGSQIPGRMGNVIIMLYSTYANMGRPIRAPRRCKAFAALELKPVRSY